MSKQDIYQDELYLIDAIDEAIREPEEIDLVHLLSQARGMILHLLEKQNRQENALALANQIIKTNQLFQSKFVKVSDPLESILVGVKRG